MRNISIADQEGEEGGEGERGYGWSQDSFTPVGDNERFHRFSTDDSNRDDSLGYRDSLGYDYNDDMIIRPNANSEVSGISSEIHMDDDQLDLIRTQAENIIKCVLDRKKKGKTKNNEIEYPESYLSDYAQTHYILSRTKLFSSNSSLDKVLSWKNVFCFYFLEMYKSTIIKM